MKTLNVTLRREIMCSEAITDGLNQTPSSASIRRLLKMAALALAGISTRKLYVKKQLVRSLFPPILGVVTIGTDFALRPTI